MRASLAQVLGHLLQVVGSPALIDPDVRAVHTGGVVVEREVDGYRRASVPEVGDPLSDTRSERAGWAGCRQQPCIGFARADAGDNDGSTLLVGDGSGTAVIGDAHADRSAVLDEDFIDVLAQADLSSGCADPFLDHARDLSASPAWEPCSVHVVAHDHRVGDECAARGLYPVVAPMRGEEGAQGWVAESPLHVVLCPFQGASCPQAQREVNGGGRLWRDHLGHVAQRHPRIGARDVPTVAPNRPSFGGK